MKRNPTEEILKGIRLFDRCTSKEIAALASLCTTVNLESGRELTVQGRRGEEFFVILAGHAAVYVDGDLVAMTGAGQPLGEHSLLSGEPRNATVVTTTPITALVMSVVEFRSALFASPGLGLGLLAATSDREPQSTSTV
jgi:trk system potassium uptake protein TrkA